MGSDLHPPPTAAPALSRSVDWLPLVLLGLASLASVYVVEHHYRFKAWHGLINTPAVTVLLMLAAVTAPSCAPARYRWSIVAGVAWSALGDAFLLSGRDLFVAGLGSFLVAHGCYLWAFTADSRWAGWKTPFVAWSLVGLVILPQVWPGVAGSIRIPVLLYMVALLSMAAQGASRALQRRDISAVAAAIGAAFFVASDTLLALRRFAHVLAEERVWVLGTYFIAQMGIVISVVFYCRCTKCSSSTDQLA